MNELYEYQASSLKKLDTLRNRILKDAYQTKRKYKNHLSLLLKISTIYQLIMVTDTKTIQASMTTVLENIRLLKQGMQ